MLDFPFFALVLSGPLSESRVRCPLLYEIVSGRAAVNGSLVYRGRRVNKQRYIDVFKHNIVYTWAKVPDPLAVARARDLLRSQGVR